ncbi:MAG: C40 family peptidase [Phycisphaerales bacterium]|nr:C40 family peptidase [Phycisphaerales bacterium]
MNKRALMFCPPLLLMVFAMSLAMHDPLPLALVDRIEQVIAAFEPPWLPTERPLRGTDLVLDVASDPPGGGSWDSVPLFAAEYLYHLVKQGGARPRLLRGGTWLPVEEDEAAGPPLPVNRQRITITWQGESAAAPRVVVEARGPAAEADTLAAHVQNALRTRLADLPFMVDWRPASGADAAAELGLRLRVQWPAPTAESPAGWRVYRGLGRGVYEGLASYHRQVLQRPAATPTRAEAETRRFREAERLARSIFPEGALPPERAGWFCEKFVRLGVRDRSLTLFVLAAETDGETVTLRGSTNVPALALGVERALASVGLRDVRNEIRTLPDEVALGGQRFGICCVPHMLSYDRPGDGGGLQTQLLLGEPVFLLDRRDGHYLLHASDGYWGWVPETAIQPVAEDEFWRYLDAPVAVVLEEFDLGGLRVPRGARVAWQTDTEGREQVWIPGHAPLPVASAHLRPVGPNGRTELRLAAALDLLHIPYVFGGRSPWGLDCSGLVTNIAAQAGDRPARDAWQQALGGTLVATATARAGLRAGDLVYFTNASGRIYHTGIALSATHFLHASPPAVRINSLRAGDRLYDAGLDQDFFLAKRP